MRPQRDPLARLELVVIADDFDGGGDGIAAAEQEHDLLGGGAHALELGAVEQTQIVGMCAAMSLPVRPLALHYSRRRRANEWFMSKTAIVVGAGHNGLVAAVMLAKRGVKVRVLEDKPVIGGAVRTERPFGKAPGLATSTGAYLLGLMPPEIMAATGVQIPVMRRDPHYFLPTTDKRYLLFGSDQEAMKRQFIDFFSEEDWRANQAMNDEIGKIRDDIARTWMEEPLSIEETAEKYVRTELRQAFVDLCRKPVGEYIDRFGFKSDLVRAMYAVTDGFSGALRLVGHARHRHELPHPQHVPAARLRRHVDDRQGRHGHRHAR